MQLPSRDGISCDLCGLVCRHDFTYYSYDCYAVAVHGNQRPPVESIMSEPVSLSIDCCPACFDKHKQLVVTNYAKIMSPKRRAVIGTLCELSGKLLAGTYGYHYVVVTKAVVRKSKLTTDPRHLELSICEEIYKGLIATIEAARAVTDNWTTTS